MHQVSSVDLGGERSRCSVDQSGPHFLLPLTVNRQRNDPSQLRPNSARMHSSTAGVAAAQGVAAASVSTGCQLGGSCVPLCAHSAAPSLLGRGAHVRGGGAMAAGAHAASDDAGST
jgi:hypothetical protein